MHQESFQCTMLQERKESYYQRMKEDMQHVTFSEYLQKDCTLNDLNKLQENCSECIEQYGLQKETKLHRHIRKTLTVLIFNPTILLYLADLGPILRASLVLYANRGRTCQY